MAGWISVAAAAASAAYSSYESHEAKKDAREAAKEALALSELNASAAEQENQEAMRREERQQESDESLARAKAAASGVDIDDGSVGGYLQDMKAENELQLDWMKRSGLMNVDIIRRGGMAAYNQGKATAKAHQRRALGSIIEGVGDVASGAARSFTSPTTSKVTTTTASPKFSVKNTGFYTNG